MPHDGTDIGIVDMSEHTPGPWTIERRETGLFVFGPHWMLAQLIAGDSNEEITANARLIAAAPELLAALKGVVAVADRKTVEFDRARAAIAMSSEPKEENHEGH